MKEVKMYEADDGKLYKTKAGAENHSKRIAAQSVMDNLSMTDSEVFWKLQKVAEFNVTIRVLLNQNPDWKKWPKHLILKINEDLFKEPSKKTLYVREYRGWREDKEEIIVEELGDEFTSPELHLVHEGIDYKVERVEEVGHYIRKVFYDYKYTELERATMKLKKGEKLSENEIRLVVHELDQVLEEEGEEGRWERYMTTVVQLDDRQYAIDWSRGLTESQENSYYEQPYQVKVTVEEVVITRNVITRVEEDVEENIDEEYKPLLKFKMNKD